MMIDPAKKVILVRWAVLIASAIFMLTSARALQSTGWLHRVNAKAVATMSQQKTLAETLQTHWKQLDVLLSKQEVTRFAMASPAAVGYTAQTLRDPLQSLLPEEATPLAQRMAEVAAQAPTPPPPPTLTIRGVSLGPSEPKAIINDHVYGIGDVISEGKILAIDQHGITIDYHGSSLVYPLKTTANGTGQSVSPLPLQRAQWR